MIEDGCWLGTRGGRKRLRLSRLRYNPIRTGNFPATKEWSTSDLFFSFFCPFLLLSLWLIGEVVPQVALRLWCCMAGECKTANRADRRREKKKRRREDDDDVEEERREERGEGEMWKERISEGSFPWWSVADRLIWTDAQSHFGQWIFFFSFFSSLQHATCQSRFDCYRILSIIHIYSIYIPYWTYLQSNNTAIDVGVINGHWLFISSLRTLYLDRVSKIPLSQNFLSFSHSDSSSRGNCANASNVQRTSCTACMQLNLAASTHMVSIG